MNCLICRHVDLLNTAHKSKVKPCTSSHPHGYDEITQVLSLLETLGGSKRYGIDRWRWLRVRYGSNWISAPAPWCDVMAPDLRKRGEIRLRNWCEPRLSLKGHHQEVHHQMSWLCEGSASETPELDQTIIQLSLFICLCSFRFIFISSLDVMRRVISCGKSAERNAISDKITTIYPI